MPVPFRSVGVTGRDGLMAGLADEDLNPTLDSANAGAGDDSSLRLIVASSAAPAVIDLHPPGTWLFGRAEESDIFIDDPTVSRQHARLTIERDRDRLRAFIEDLGSSNGTRV